MHASSSRERSDEITFKRAVYESICALSDYIDEKKMLENLQQLDIHSWAQVLEERYLGRLCGFPTCSNSIKIEFRQKYKIDRRNKTFIETNSECAKFCSELCHSRYKNVQCQLSELPLWITGQRNEKTFCIEDSFNSEDGTSENLQMLKNDEIASLNDANESVVFSYGIRTALQSPIPSANAAKNPRKFQQNFNDEQKLQLLRDKYGRKNEKAKKSNVHFVEPMAKKEPDSTRIQAIQVEKVLDYFDQWLGRESRQFLTSIGEDEMVLYNYYRGDVENRQKSDVFLPHVDSLDYSARRMEIFLNRIKNGWMSVQNTFNLTVPKSIRTFISTLNLTSDNLDLSASQAKLVAVVLYFLLCDEEYEEFLQNSELLSKFRIFLDSFGCEIDTFLSVFRFVRNILQRL